MTELVRKPLTSDRAYVELAGKSSDSKPTKGIAEGSICVEVNTGKVFFFNGTSWTEQFSFQS